MYLALTVFFVSTLGLRILLGCIVLYVLLPSDARCIACDRETFAVVPPPGLAWLGRLFRMERRWCLPCEKTMIVRRQRRARLWVGPVDGMGEHVG